MSQSSNASGTNAFEPWLHSASCSFEGRLSVHLYAVLYVAASYLLLPILEWVAAVLADVPPFPYWFRHLLLFLTGSRVLCSLLVVKVNQMASRADLVAPAAGHSRRKRHAAAGMCGGPGRLVASESSRSQALAPCTIADPIKNDFRDMRAPIIVVAFCLRRWSTCHQLPRARACVPTKRACTTFEFCNGTQSYWSQKNRIVSKKANHGSFLRRLMAVRTPAKFSANARSSQ